MSLKEKVNSDIKEAMKSGDKVRLTAIRSIKALILEFEKSGINRDLTTEEELGLITSAAKKRKDSLEQFTNAGRIDLAEIEEQELAILSEYLPKQLTDEEIEASIRELAKEIGAENKSHFRNLMPAAAKSLKGKADGRKVKEIVEKILS